MKKEWIMKRLLYTILFCIAAIVLCFAIYNIVHVLLTALSVEGRLAETVGRIMACVVILLFYKKTFDMKAFGIRRENFWRGILTGGFMFAVIVANIPISIGDVAEYPAAAPSLYLILIILIEQIFIGVYEEFLFRGLVQNILLEKFSRYGHKGAVWAILSTSILFGAVHMLNLFDTPEIVRITIFQSVGAAFMGFFLGALYYRCRNIWVVVFYHAFIDTAGIFPTIFHTIPETTGAVTDCTFAEMWLNIAANSVFLFVGLFLLRPSKSHS